MWGKLWKNTLSSISYFIKHNALFIKSEVKMGVFEMSTYYMCNFSLTTQFADVEPTKKSLLRKKPFLDWILSGKVKCKKHIRKYLSSYSLVSIWYHHSTFYDKRISILIRLEIYWTSNCFNLELQTLSQIIGMNWVWNIKILKISYWFIL